MLLKSLLGKLSLLKTLVKLQAKGKTGYIIFSEKKKLAVFINILNT